MPAKKLSKDNNNDYKKDINFLDQDLVQSIKPTVHIKGKKNKNKNDSINLIPEDHSSWLQKIIHHDKKDKKPKEEKEEKPEKSEVKFQSGTGDRFDLDIDMDTPKEPKEKTPYTPNDKPKQTTVSESVSSAPVPVPPLVPPVSSSDKETKEDSHDSSRFHPPAPVKPISKILEKEEEEEKPAKEEEKAEPKNHLSLPSIRDLMDRDSKKEDKETAKAPDDFDVNLIPTELRAVESSAAAFKKIGLVGGISILAIVAILIGLSLFGANDESEIANIKQQVEEYEREIQEASDAIERLAIFTDQTKKVGEILQGREVWSALFDLLEEETLPEVYYTSVSVSSDDRVILQAIARSYHDMGRQYKIFNQNPNIIGLNMNSVSLDTALWEDYTNLAKLELERMEESGEVATTTQFSFDRETLKSLLTVESTISFQYIINPTSTILDKYE